MLESLLKQRQKRTQLHFRDDGRFQFRRLEILDGFLVDRVGEEIVSAWLMTYKLLKRFNGYRHIGSDMVTLCYDRDILLDNFNQLADAEKPDQGIDLKKAFVTNIATAKCYRHERGKKSRTIYDKMVLFLGTAIILEVITMMIIGARG